MSKQGCSKAVITGFFQSICGRSKVGSKIYLCPECTQLEADKQLNLEDYESIWVALDYLIYNTVSDFQHSKDELRPLQDKVDAKIEELKGQ